MSIAVVTRQRNSKVACFELAQANLFQADFQCGGAFEVHVDNADSDGHSFTRTKYKAVSCVLTSPLLGKTWTSKPYVRGVDGAKTKDLKARAESDVYAQALSHVTEVVAVASRSRSRSRSWSRRR